jgi:hypothetical protein
MALRRSRLPLVVMVCVAAGVSAITIYVGFARDPAGAAWAIALIWALFAAVAFYSSRFRIYWNATAIRSRVLGKADVVIPMASIERVAAEASIKSGRPLQRLSFHGRGESGAALIDLSVKQFFAEDIRALMHTVHRARPDLDMPPEWR